LGTPAISLTAKWSQEMIVDEWNVSLVENQNFEAYSHE
jgi:hypothetical protein